MRTSCWMLVISLAACTLDRTAETADNLTASATDGYCTPAPQCTEQDHENGTCCPPGHTPTPIEAISAANSAVNAYAISHGYTLSNPQQNGCSLTSGTWGAGTMTCTTRINLLSLLECTVTTTTVFDTDTGSWTQATVVSCHTT